jgi:hypothetical protein
VVGHDIDDQPHPVRRERRDHRRELGIGTELGIEAAVIDDVVTMRRAGPRLHQRRRIKMADAEPGQVRHQRGGVLEGEVLVELQAIGGADFGMRG